MWTIWRYRTTKRFCLWRSSLPLTADCAESFEMDREDLKRRRAQSVRNVKATNGLISLEKYARFRQEQDWDDDEWQN